MNQYTPRRPATQLSYMGLNIQQIVDLKARWINL